MARALALHHLTVREVSAPRLIEIAASLGCPDVCVFTHAPRIPIPGATFTRYPLVSNENLKDVLAAMDAHGVGIGNIEFFPVTEHPDLGDYRPSFEIGAAIGARRAVTHIHDSEPMRAVDTLGRLCDVAAEYGLKLGLEFMGLTPACASIGQALNYVIQVGRDNIGVALDALHLVRTGGTAEDVAAIPPHHFCYAQICDGFGMEVTGDYRGEGQDRQAPGDGDWPLQAIFSALPAATPVDVEIPSTTRVGQGIDPEVRARDAVTKSRALMARIAPTR